MFWNVTFIYRPNAFIRTTDHCKVQTAFVSSFYIFVNMKPWNASNSSVVVVGLLLIMLNGALNANLLILLRYGYLSLGHLTIFLYEFLRIFYFLKIRWNSRIFFAEVTNSRSMLKIVPIVHFNAFLKFRSSPLRKRTSGIMYTALQQNINCCKKEKNLAENLIFSRRLFTRSVLVWWL